MAEIELIETGKTDCVLAYEGHVDNVIKGIIPEYLKNKRFSALDVKFGFELGSPQGIYNLGECIILNDLIYSSRTDTTRNFRDPLMWGPEFVTSGIFVVPKSGEHTHLVKYCDLDENISLRKLYQFLYKKLEGPFAIAGCAELSFMRSRSITYSPIEHENIFENERKYYAENEYISANDNIAFMGAVSNMADDKLSAINQKLKSVLYYNPYNKQPPELVTHTHALTLNRPVVDIESVEPHHAKSVIHITDDSVLRYLKAYVFKISDIKEGI